MYVWVDALTNYITGGRLSRHREREVQALLAGRPARDRQGHRALPRGLLAGVPDVGRHRGAAPHLLPRLPVQPRGKDVEVGRQRGRSVRARRRLWRRSAALLPAARGPVRAGRQLQPRGDRQPHQCRPRERPRQPGAALALDDRQAARRRDADAGRVLGERPDDPGRRRRDDRQGARGDEDASSCTRCSTRSGPWWRTPTAISPAKRRGRSPRPIRRGRARCCT